MPAIELCERLMQKAGLSGVSVDRNHDIDRILVDGTPVVLGHDESRVILIAGFSGCQILVQTNPDAYQCVEGVTGRDEVLVEIAKIPERELALHLEQAWHACRKAKDG